MVVAISNWIFMTLMISDLILIVLLISVWVLMMLVISDWMFCDLHDFGYLFNCFCDVGLDFSWFSWFRIQFLSFLIWFVLWFYCFSCDFHDSGYVFCHVHDSRSDVVMDFVISDWGFIVFGISDWMFNDFCDLALGFHGFDDFKYLRVVYVFCVFSYWILFLILCISDLFLPWCWWVRIGFRLCFWFHLVFFCFWWCRIGFWAL